MAKYASRAQQVNGMHSSTAAAEEEELYDQLLRLRDAVIAGTHPHLKLPAAAIESLKPKAHAHASGEAAERPAVNGIVNNGIAFNANTATTNNLQQSSQPAAPSFPGLPGLQPSNRSVVNSAYPPALKPTSSGGLDPIFLEKSDSLVRAEGQLKRQRIERELQTQVEQRRPAHITRERDFGVDGSVLDVETILVDASARAPHVSGLASAKAASPASSSFDENDYYSSQVESDWSSPKSASKGSDRATGVFPVVTRSREAPNVSSHATSRPAQANNASFQDPLEMEDDEDDDEYDPADVTAFDSYPSKNIGLQAPPPEEDDDSDYEPGEITQESAVATPNGQGNQPAQPSPQVPVIRNHLTHIAAPQPNRVSPLAVAKRPSIELELVNGRPEVVQKGRSNHHAQSRPSSGSPPNGVGGSGKKRAKKKRKRDNEVTTRGSNNKKSRRERHPAQSPPSPAHQQPYIKSEPTSPPPLSNVPEAPPYGQRATQYRPAEVDLVSPRHAPPHVQYAHEPPHSGLRYEYAAPTSPAAVRVASPAYRSVHRDTQDLRRVASLHYAQRPSSPAQQAYSPAPSRTVSMTYGDPRLGRALESQQYQQQVPPEAVRYVRSDRSRSPPRLQEYHDPYARASSPAMMPPPAAVTRRIVVDQYGNRYYATDPSSAMQPPPSRASVAPVDRRATIEPGYDRAPSRMTSYAQPSPALAPYEPADSRMNPPPPPSQQRRPMQDDRSVQYVDSNGYRVRDYEPANGQIRYVEAPTSPVYQQVPAARYEAMPPPPTVPMRSYSVRPEEAAPMPMPTPISYAPRHASVAPTQYARQDASALQPAPARAMSVVPGYEQPAAPARDYSQAPSQPRYVDQYGRELFAPEFRQVPAPEYRYQ